MRHVRVEADAPEGALRLVGVLAGEVLEPVGVDVSALASIGFTGELGKVQPVLGPDGPLLMVGLGDEIDTDRLCRAVAAGVRVAPTDRQVATTLHTLDLDGAVSAVAVGAQLGSYRFNEYLTNPGDEPQGFVLVGSVADDEVERAVVLAEGVCQARDWVNRAPEEEAPAVLADEMARMLGEAGFEIETWDEDRIVAERLGGLAGVARGSDRPPRMLIARREGSGDAPHLALVGKGIVFDSGGLSIKTSEGMQTMKSDMAGAAAVVAAAVAIGRLGLGLKVSVFVPLTDNMPGGSATKPGDVLTARNGKTIEVLNTDAEGRLVLADALSLAAEQEPDLIVDVATLTGAAKIALGLQIAAVFASSEEVSNSIAAAADRSDERVWPMPVPEDYRALLSSGVADMKNTGGRYGGAITAALFLSEFVGGHPWAHLDVAGPAWSSEDRDTGPQGGTGFGVRTLVALAEGMSGSSDPAVS